MFLIEYGGGFRNVKPAFCKAIGGMIEQRKQCFFKKKRAKNFASGGIWRGTPPSPRESKVFCFFFQKRSAFFHLPCAPIHAAPEDLGWRFSDSFTD
jgi:hypothetical protein